MNLESTNGKDIQLSYSIEMFYETNNAILYIFSIIIMKELFSRVYAQFFVRYQWRVLSIRTENGNPNAYKTAMSVRAEV